MKRVTAVLLMLMMILSAACAEEIPAGEEPQAIPPERVQYDYDELVVGNTMPMYGAFSLDNWGNSTSDVDVRKLIHGYNLVEWSAADGGFHLDPSVVTIGSLVTADEAGNHVYHLALYEDMYYSDGTKITARDYAFSWLLRTSELINEIGGTAETADYLVGWNAYITGETPYLAGIHVVDDYQLRIMISAEYLPYFYEVGLLECYPYPIHVIAPGCEVADDGQGVYIRNTENPEGEPLFTADLLKQTLLDETNGYLSHPAVVSGAYRLVSYDGTEVRFELNPYYKGNSQGVKPTILRIVYRVANPDTMMDELLRGEYGLLNKVTRKDVVLDGMTRGVGEAHYAVANYLRPGLSFIAFNGTRAATADPEVRKAIALCLDKDGLRQDYVGDFGMVVDGFYGMGQWMYQIVNGTMAQEPDENMTEQEQEQLQEAWEALTLDSVPTYSFNTAQAIEILDNAGWTLNRDGAPYDSSRDEVRCKEIGGEIIPLELKLVYPESTNIGEILENRFAAPLKEAGVLLTIEGRPDVLPIYYGQTEADYDMLYLATNFEMAYDPSALFMEGYGLNVSGVKDEELVQLALDMRRTEEGDLLTYCTKWVRFLERFAEIEPMIPIYSNVYYDFHAPVLQNYQITQNITWSDAIISSFLSDVPEDEPVPEEEEQVPEI